MPQLKKLGVKILIERKSLKEIRDKKNWVRD